MKRFLNYEQFLDRARKDFNIGITEKWILTQLRLLLISENVDYKMLHIGKRKNDEEKTFEKNKNESKARENESEESIEISEQVFLKGNNVIKHGKR